MFSIFGYSQVRQLYISFYFLFLSSFDVYYIATYSMNLNDCRSFLPFFKCMEQFTYTV